MSDMQRVTKKDPCPICNRPDWCLLGKSVAMCMRVPSPRAKTLSDGSVGYIHRLDGSTHVAPTPPRPKKEEPVQNWDTLLSGWRSTLGSGIAPTYCQRLGLPVSALACLGAQRAPWHDTVAFPMRNGSNAVVGVRLRNGQGNKWAVTGSHQGLFIPQQEMDSAMAFFVEGPTNAAAGLSIGVYTVGRPNNVGGVFDIIALINRLKIRKAVIIADTDVDKERPDGSKFNPGADGACALSAQLTIPNCTLLMPVKDMRDFVAVGGTKTMLNYMIDQCVWRRP